MEGGIRESQSYGDYYDMVIDFSTNTVLYIIAKGQLSFGVNLCYGVLEANISIKLFWTKREESQRPKQSICFK